MQRALDFGRADRIERGRQKALRVIADVVDELGLEAACGACDARRSELIDALGGRDSRYFRIDWLLAIYDIANADQRARLQEAVFPQAQKLTPEERLARLEMRVSTHFGEAGARLVEENQRR